MKAIGIIGAMPSELADIRVALGEGEVQNISGFEFHVNGYEDVIVVSACCGIGKINAALCTQAMISEFHIDRIINTGIAGGMHNDVKVCDIVISTEAIIHDFEPFFLKDYPCGGIFKADEDLINKAADACEDASVKYFKGHIISGDVFVTDSVVKASLVDKYNPYAVDMESAAIAHACYMNDASFVSVRCISDNADDEGAMSFEEFEKIAAKKVADIVLAIVRKLN